MSLQAGRTPAEIIAENGQKGYFQRWGREWRALEMVTLKGKERELALDPHRVTMALEKLCPQVTAPDFRQPSREEAKEINTPTSVYTSSDLLTIPPMDPTAQDFLGKGDLFIKPIKGFLEEDRVSEGQSISGEAERE